MRKLSLNRIVGAIFDKKNRLFLYLIFVLFFIGFLSVFANKWTSSQKIEKIIIYGNTFIPTSEIFSCIDSTVTGQLTENNDFIDLKDITIKHPFIYKSYIMHKNPSIIEIEVKERIPVALLIKNDGNLCYADSTACLLPYRLSLKFGEFPLIRGIFSESSVDSTALAGAILIVNQLNESKNGNLLQLVSEIDYNRITKLFSIYTSDNEYCIYFGKAEEVSDKIELLSDFFATKLPSVDIKNLQYIDVRWRDRVVLKYKSV
jgi:hypothetical protein